MIIHTKACDYTTYMTLGKMMEKLPIDEFIRISRFEVVSLCKIRTLDSRMVVLKDGKALQISDRYAEAGVLAYETYRSKF